MPKGSAHGMAKVNKNQVRWIRSHYQPHLKGGGHYETYGSIRHMSFVVGLSRRQVKRIITGENWGEKEKE